MNKEKTLQMLETLFHSTLDKEWTKESYLLADLIKMVNKPSEVAFRELVIAEVVDSMSDSYRVPRIICKGYLTDEVIDNILDRMDEAMVREIEEFVASTDILQYEEK